MSFPWSSFTCVTREMSFDIFSSFFQSEKKKKRLLITLRLLSNKFFLFRYGFHSSYLKSWLWPVNESRDLGSGKDLRDLLVQITTDEGILSIPLSLPNGCKASPWIPSGVSILWSYFLDEIDSFSKMSRTDRLNTKSFVHSCIHSFLWQIFIEHLLCARLCVLSGQRSAEPMWSLPSWSSNKGGRH